MTPSELINREFEQAALGAFLTDSVCYAEIPIAISDFGTVDHQKLFSAIVSVYEENRLTDPLIVANHLDKEGELNRVGGADYIHQLHATCVDTALENITFYVQELKRLSLKRKYIAELSKATQQMKELDTNPEAVMAKVVAFSESHQPQSQKISYVTRPELAKMEFPEVKWLVPDFLPSGLTVLSGAAKVGKSLFCLNISIAVSTGGIAFSNREELRIPEQRQVTYLDLENGKQLLQDRLHKLDPDQSAPFIIIDKTDLGNIVFNSIGLKSIEKHIKETDTELLIVDTWEHVRPETPKKGTAYNQDYQALIPIQKMALDLDIGIVLVTHDTKAVNLLQPFNNIQGSMGMQAGADTMMRLSHDSGSKTLSITGRRVIAEDYAFEVDNSTGLWMLQGEAQTYHRSDIANKIIGALEEFGTIGMSAKHISEEIGKKESSIYSALRRMVRDGEIVQPRIRGHYFINNSQEEQVEINL